MAVKIAIVGLGGVGGFIGGSLADHYMPGHGAVEVYFIARGETLRTVAENGLTVETPQRTFTARPTKVTDDASQIGVMDYVIYCTKSYDVEEGIRSVLSCIGPDTVVIPFLNGVDGAERIKQLLPCNEVWDGCVYIVSRIGTPGHIIADTGGYFYLFGSAQGSKRGVAQGSMQGSSPRIAQMSAIFAEAGIKAYAVEDIERQVWNKFGFISPMGTITSYTDKTYGGVMDDPAEKTRLLALIGEFTAVAHAKGVDIADDLSEDVMRRVGKLPWDATTSMQRDFRAHHKTELEALTGYIVREGERLGVAVPTYRMMYDGLLARL